ncbi:MAG TPA: alanine--tRNA ligase-related protein, partial [Gillisia sp.]|nr:alanine--tRNA ligase-related protein [Gillisia sp.]
VLLEKIIAETEGKVVSGKKAFELFDTFGFPIDLTALILRERGYSLNEDEFNSELQQQKDRSRAASVVTAGDWNILGSEEATPFIGYDAIEAPVQITRYRKVDSKKDGKLFQIVLNQTPFYPEGGGQVGDKGILLSPEGEKIEVLDTKKENNLIIHFTKTLPKDLAGVLTAKVDIVKRRRTEANHSATHLLHQALRHVLGTHVEQKGSMVNHDYLRFDFSHFSKLSEEELQQVENFVNARIQENITLNEQRNLTYNEAIEQGAIALFGEKYGDSVRAIKFGDSMELCGGTHVKTTADIWYFKITSEGAVAAGIRRIEAITGDAVKKYFNKQTEILHEVSNVLKNTKNPVKAIQSIQDENTMLKKEIEVLLREKAKDLKGELQKELTEINGISFLAKKVDLDASGIKDLAFQLGENNGNLFLLLASEKDGKALLSCYISKDLVKQKDLDAGKVVRELGKFIQGGGGGQPFFATAGGKNPGGISEALERAKDFIA